MLLESQNQFIEDYFKPLSRGEGRELPVGYKEMYAKWQLLIHVSHIFRPMKKGSCSTDFIDTEVKKNRNKPHSRRYPCRSKNKKLIARGQVVLRVKTVENLLIN